MEGFEASEARHMLMFFIYTSQDEVVPLPSLHLQSS